MSKKKNVTTIAAKDVLPPDEKISEETFHKYFENFSYKQQIAIAGSILSV